MVMREGDRINAEKEKAEKEEAKKYKGVVCRGSWMLNTACGTCERCIDTMPVIKYMPRVKPPRLSPDEERAKYSLTRKDKIGLYFVRLLMKNTPSVHPVEIAARMTEEFIKRFDE